MEFNRRLLLTSATPLLGTMVSCTAEVASVDDRGMDATTGDPMDSPGITAARRTTCPTFEVAPPTEVDADQAAPLPRRAASSHAVA